MLRITKQTRTLMSNCFYVYVFPLLLPYGHILLGAHMNVVENLQFLHSAGGLWGYVAFSSGIQCKLLQFSLRFSQDFNGFYLVQVHVRTVVNLYLWYTSFLFLLYYMNTFCFVSLGLLFAKIIVVSPYFFSLEYYNFPVVLRRILMDFIWFEAHM